MLRGRILQFLCCLNGAANLASSFQVSFPKWKSPYSEQLSTTPPATKNKVEEFYSFWNERDMIGAASCFTDDCIYEDTVYPKPFVGREGVRSHFQRCADALPENFQFVVDKMSVADTNIGVKWHVEDGKGNQLPFTRGCSMYEINKQNGLIQSGFDVVEPALFKSGDLSLNLLSMASKIIAEPVRVIPAITWGAYMYIVFFSNGILPGADALQLEQRTWEEVRGLSLNFFLVAPLLQLPFAPVIHPGLEGIFNLLLSWAALFAGFLSDERKNKRNQLNMVPVVLGMQFLTSAFLLPYLVTRTSEKNEEPVIFQDMGKIQGVICENRILPLVLSSVGTGSIFWALFGRPEFGAFSERFQSLVDILSIDRVGSSFIVDLVIFALFQGWLVDDDLRRRCVDDNELSGLRAIAKFIPFYGMVVYFMLRPSLESSSLPSSFEDEGDFTR